MSLQAFLSANRSALTENKFIGICGASGTGKTQLIRALAQAALERQAWVGNFNAGKVSVFSDQPEYAALTLKESVALGTGADELKAEIQIKQLKTVSSGLKSALMQAGTIACPHCKAPPVSLKVLNLPQILSHVSTLGSNPELVIASRTDEKGLTHRTLMKRGVSQLIFEGLLQMLGDLSALPQEFSVVKHITAAVDANRNFLQRLLFTEPSNKYQFEVWGRSPPSHALKRVCHTNKELFCPACGDSFDFAELLSMRAPMKLGHFVLTQLEKSSLLEFARQLSSVTALATKEPKTKECLELERFLDLARGFGLGALGLEREIGSLASGEGFLLNLAHQLAQNGPGKFYLIDRVSAYLGAQGFDRLINKLSQLARGETSVLVADCNLPSNAKFELSVSLAPTPPLKACTAPQPVSTQEISKPSNHSDAALQIRCRLVNQKLVELSIPLRQLAVLTGDTGAGKTSLINTAIYASLVAQKKRQPLPAHVGHFSLSASVGRAAYVERLRAHEEKRSTVFKLLGLDLELANHFSKLEDSRIKGVSPKEFMGKRTPRLERITYKQKSYQEFLSLSLAQLFELISHLPVIGEVLRFANALGLGQILASRELGTLSLGEFQALYLATKLQTKIPNTLFVLERPASGLDQTTTLALVNLIQLQVLSRGHSIIAEESNDFFISLSDWSYQV